MRELLKAIFILVLALTSGRVLADLPIALVDEARLPYDYSPSNYDNSPSNYNNSISNYDNSPSNYDNSESNYDNSASNYENNRNGNRRIIYSSNGSGTFAGYYAIADNGTQISSRHLERECSTRRKAVEVFFAERMGASAGR